MKIIYLFRHAGLGLHMQKWTLGSDDRVYPKSFRLLTDKAWPLAMYWHCEIHFSPRKIVKATKYIWRDSAIDTASSMRHANEHVYLEKGDLRQYRTPIHQYRIQSRPESNYNHRERYICRTANAIRPTVHVSCHINWKASHDIIYALGCYSLCMIPIGSWRTILTECSNLVK